MSAHAVSTSIAGEVGRGAIKVMGQTSRLLEIDHSVWKQSYNACPTVLYSIDIGSVSVFTVQIDDTSENKALLLTQRRGGIFQKWGPRSYWALKQKSPPGSNAYAHRSLAEECNDTIIKFCYTTY